MAELKTMYPGVANSPETFLKEALTIDGEIMYLADGSVLGEIPTLAVIGEGQQAETVLVVSTRSDGGFVIIRGVEGPKKAWTKATTVARNWTNKDYETLVQNIKQNSFYIDNLEDEFKSNILSMQRYTDNKVGRKVDKIDGKGLSTNDYDDVAKAKVDAIPDDPKYTDTVPDLTPYAKKTEIKTRLADLTSDSTHRTATDAEKRAWNGKVDKVDGKGLSTNDYDAEAKKKVDAIPPNPKYTDTVPDLSPYAKTADVNTAMADKVDKDAILDKQYLYDILIGESLITRKAGKWPVVHGKPTIIEQGAFWGDKLTNVVIPPSVTSIEANAFNDNQLTSVIIPSSVTSIGSSAFMGNQLTSVIIPSSVTDIESGAFQNNQLTSVVISPGVKSIGPNAFNNNQLTSVIIPPSVTSIRFYAFLDNNLSEVKVPKNCSIESEAFDSGVNIIRY